MALFLASRLIEAFSGKGLVPDALTTDPVFLLAVAVGGALTVIFATPAGMPASKPMHCWEPWSAQVWCRWQHEVHRHRYPARRGCASLSFRRHGGFRKQHVACTPTSCRGMMIGQFIGFGRRLKVLDLQSKQCSVEGDELL